MNNKKKIIILIVIITVIFLIAGSTFAYWRWQTLRNEEANIALTFSGSSNDLYARIEGGEPITNIDVTLLPTNNCLGNTALQRTVSITYKNGTSQSAKIEAQMDVTIFELQQGRTLTNDDLSHIHWAITTNASSCSADVVSSGTFEGITFTNSQISNMTNDPVYGNLFNLNNGNSMITINVPSGMQNETTSSNYYAYVWIDEDYKYTNLGNEVTDPMSDFYLQLTWHGKIYQYIPGPNAPELVPGLIPVKLSDSGNTVTTVAPNDPTWYNYNEKKWANAILVNENTHTRNYYKSNSGTVVPQEDILAYYVWIPRYSYKVWAYSGTDSSGNPHEIPIKFIDNDTIDMATKIGEYYTHPAFWWDDDSDSVRDSGEELSGIWVGKFETSHATLSPTSNSLGTDSGATICNSTRCNNFTGLRILPNVRPLISNRISNYFYSSRFMESSGNPFGLVSSNADSHMMKKSEWGAVSYLSHSKYGINTEVEINNSYKTGCGSDGSCSVSDEYTKLNTYPQSTTGNVTGVFDMSGGANEYVMGHFGSTTTYGTKSGFSSTNPLPDSKYYDNYGNPPFDDSDATNFSNCTLATCGGQALFETKNWYDDGAWHVTSTRPWVHCGSFVNAGSLGGLFYTSYSSGNYSVNYSSRLVLIAE